MARYYKHHDYYRVHHRELTEKSRSAKAKRVLDYLLKHLVWIASRLTQSCSSSITGTKN
jgi:hypothetical protein